MKRLLIILFCLPLLFACSKEMQFEEGQEVVLNLSVDMGDMQSAATRAMGDNVVDTPALWLAVFDGEGYLVEWTKASHFTQDGGETKFQATLHATMEKRVMHFLLNYVDDSAELELDYGHENNVIGGLTVERNRDVYWQRVELPDGINGSTDPNGTVKKYLTKVPLVRNFSKITVTVTENENTAGFVLDGFYVLNVPNHGTVAPFINGSFVKYYNENAQFNGDSFTPKTYDTLNTEGYTGTMPDDDERINKHTEFTESTTLLDKDASYYLYESTYINGNKDKTVSVLLKGKLNDKDYWYRVDLVKPNEQGVIEYLNLLRNFAYNINITAVTAGKPSAQDAIEQPAGNNILSSLDIAHLTNVSDGTATLEVNYTDTVLITNDAVTVRYKFTDNGNGTGTKNTNENIEGKTNDCGWYLTYDGTTAPVTVSVANEDATGGWRDVTISVTGAITERKEVSITFFAKSSTATVLSRTVHYTLMPQQPMKVECPELVPATVGSEFNVNILIPDGLPEAMFPLDFAIESQAAGNTSYLAQYITPAKSETVSVKTDGSIVDISNLKGKKSFQYVVTLSYEDYKKAVVTERTLNTGQQPVSMRLYPTLFKTNTAQSASTIYAYNRYFTLGKDNFANGNVTNFTASFTNDNTATYGIGRTITLDLTAGDAGKYIIETTTLQVLTRAPLAELTMTASEKRTINLITSTFAEQAQILITCEATGVSKVIRGVERNTLNAKAKSLTYNSQSLSDTQSLGVYKSEDDAVREANRVAISTVNELLNNGVTYTVAGLAEADLLYFSYSDANNVYVASAKASDLSANSAELKFEQREFVANITDITLSGDKYYGEGNALTLKFTTDRPGEYTITLTEGSESVSKTYKVETAGTKTLNEDWLKTQTWSDQVTVTISGVNAEAKYESNIERNTIKLGKLTLSGSNVNNISNVTITYSAGSVTNQTASVSKTDLQNGTGYLEVPGITDENKNSASFVFSYTTGNGSNKKTYKSQTLTVDGVMNNTQLNFTQQ